MGNQQLNWSNLITLTDTNYAMFSLFESVRKIDEVGTPLWALPTWVPLQYCLERVTLPKVHKAQVLLHNRVPSKHKTSKHKLTSYILTPHEQPHMQLCSCGGHNHHLSFQPHRGGASKWPAVFRLPFWWDPWISIFIPCPGAPSPWFCVKRHSTDPAWLVMMRTWSTLLFTSSFSGEILPFLVLSGWNMMNSSF